MYVKPYLIFTMGDPEGVGPEIIVKSFIQKPALFRRVTPVVVGNKEILKKYSRNKFPVVAIRSIESAKKYKNLLSVIDIPKNLPAGKLSVEYIDHALAIIKKNENKIPLVTAPVSKEKIIKEGIDFPGHTEYLAKKTGTKKVAMLMVSGKYKVLVATRHIPIKEIAKKLNQDMLFEQILIAVDSIKKYFRINKVDIVVCGLNPHCGDGGKIGKEEITILSPVVKRLKSYGLKVFCPILTDEAFKKYAKNTTLIVCCYHDQAMVPLKIICGYNIVNFTCGLPFVRVSPGHGPAFDIAGKNKADPSGMLLAIETAIEASPLRKIKI